MKSIGDFLDRHLIYIAIAVLISSAVASEYWWCIWTSWSKMTGYIIHLSALGVGSLGIADQWPTSRTISRPLRTTN